MNTKIMMSGLSILASFALMGGATFAFFSSTATSTGNVFGSGTLTLNLNDVDNSPAPTITASFGTGGTPIVPGGTTTGFVSLDNVGSIGMDHVTLTVTQQANSSPSLADKLQVTTAKLGTESTCISGTPVDLLPGWETEIGGPTPPTLTQIITKGEFKAVPGPTALPASTTKYLCVTFTMNPTSDNTYQNTTTTDTFSFIGKQDSTQVP